MEKDKKLNVYVAIGVSLTAFIWIYASISPDIMEPIAPIQNQDSTDEMVLSGETNTVFYSCGDGKQFVTIVELSSGVPGKALLYLDTGNNYLMNQTMSASGVRYANEDESIILWTRGDTAFIDQVGSRTYDNCAVEQ